MDLRAQRASRHCLARQTLARLLASFASFDSVVAALVDPQLFMLAYPSGVHFMASSFDRRVCFVMYKFFFT